MSKVRCEMVPNATFDNHSSSVELHHLVLLPKTICEIVIMGFDAKYGVLQILGLDTDGGQFIWRLW